MTSRWCTTTWKRSPPVPEDALTGLLVRFAAELRTAGLAVGSGDVLVYCSALARLDPSDLVDLYWAGRVTLVSRPGDIARYDEVFRRFFLGTEGPDEELTLMLRASAQAQGALAIPAQHGRQVRDPPRPPADRPGIHAHAGRAGPAVLAAAEGPAAAAGADPGHLRVDGRLLPQPAAVRALGPAIDGAVCRARRGLLLRHPADPGHRGDGVPAPGRGAGTGGAGGLRLGRRDQDRRQPGRLRPRLGAPRAVPGRHRGDLLGRA